MLLWDWVKPLSVRQVRMYCRADVAWAAWGQARPEFAMYTWCLLCPRCGGGAGGLVARPGHHQLLALPHQVDEADVSMWSRLPIRAGGLPVHPLPRVPRRVLALHDQAWLVTQGGRCWTRAPSQADEKRQSCRLVSPSPPALKVLISLSKGHSKIHFSRTIETIHFR